MSMSHCPWLDATILNIVKRPLLDSSVNKMLFGKIPRGLLELIEHRRGSTGKGEN